MPVSPQHTYTHAHFLLFCCPTCHQFFSISPWSSFSLLQVCFLTLFVGVCISFCSQESCFLLQVRCLVITLLNFHVNPTCSTLPSHHMFLLFSFIKAFSCVFSTGFSLVSFLMAILCYSLKLGFFFSIIVRDSHLDWRFTLEGV